jgi:hypothetical protein
VRLTGWVFSNISPKIRDGGWGAAVALRGEEEPEEIAPSGSASYRMFLFTFLR